MVCRTRNTKKGGSRIVALYNERLNKMSAWKRTQRRRAQKVTGYFTEDEGEIIRYEFSQGKISVSLVKPPFSPSETKQHIIKQCHSLPSDIVEAKSRKVSKG